MQAIATQHELSSVLGHRGRRYCLGSFSSGTTVHSEPSTRDQGWGQIRPDDLDRAYARRIPACHADRLRDFQRDELPGIHVLRWPDWWVSSGSVRTSSSEKRDWTDSQP